MLSLENVRSGYDGKPVLLGVDLSVAAGEHVAVLGRNGVGKTTLIRTIMGTIPVQDGRVMLGGTDITELPAHERSRLGVAQVPQGRDIFPKLTVVENVKVAAMAHDPSGWRGRLDDVLSDFPNLTEKSRASGGSLSGGQQQALALARALVTDPRVLLLDEPSEGIQPSILDEIVETINRCSRERGVSVVLVEQNLDFASRIGQRAVVVDKGEVTVSMPMARLTGDRALQRRLLAV